MGNKAILNKYELDYFVQIKHEDDDNGQYYDIKDTPPVN